MARRAPRNEYGLTDHQQKRYDEIVSYMLDIKKESRTDSYTPRLVLQDRMNIQTSIEELKSSVETIQDTLDFFSKYKEFSDK